MVFSCRFQGQLGYVAAAQFDLAVNAVVASIFPGNADGFRVEIKGVNRPIAEFDRRNG